MVAPKGNPRESVLVDFRKKKNRASSLSNHHWSPGPASILGIGNLKSKMGLAGFADLPDLPLNVFPDLVSGHDFIIEVIRIVNIIIFPAGCQVQSYQARCDRAKEWGIWGSVFP